MKVYYYRSPNTRMFGESKSLEYKYSDVIAFCPDIGVPGTSFDFRMAFSFDNNKLVPFNVSNIFSNYWVHLKKSEAPDFHNRCIEFFEGKNIQIEVSNKKLVKNIINKK